MEQPPVISPEGIKITDQLRIEHGLLRAMMAAVGDWLVAGIPPEAMRERAAMLSTALDTHARREEERLFTPLRSLSETARHQVDMMEVVHDEVRAQFGEIASHADPIPRLWTILDLTSTHFDKEDAEVFPMAELLIEPAKLIQLGSG
jgi:hemerythrin-like domain-containing protein